MSCKSYSFGDFPKALQLLGATQKALQPLWFALSSSNQEIASSNCDAVIFSLLMKWRTSCLLNFILLYFFWVALDEVSRPLREQEGAWRSLWDTGNLIQLCVSPVFGVIFSHTHERWTNRCSSVFYSKLLLPGEQRATCWRSFAEGRPRPWISIAASICFLCPPSCCAAIKLHNVCTVAPGSVIITSITSCEGRKF